MNWNISEITIYIMLIFIQKLNFCAFSEKKYRNEKGRITKITRGKSKIIIHKTTVSEDNTKEITERNEDYEKNCIL